MTINITNSPDPDVQAQLVAKALRADVVDPNDALVSVRVRTCSECYLLAGGVAVSKERGLGQWHGYAPLQYDWVTVQMRQSQLAQERATLARLAPSEEELKAARDDLRRHIHDVAGISDSDANALPRNIDGEGFARVLYSGSLVGTSRRPYRPSWSTSFSEITGRDWHPIDAIEPVGAHAAKRKGA